MKMVMNCQPLSVVLIGVSLWILFSLSYGTETDIYCLRRVKESLDDPYGYLNSSWDFNNNTEGFICKFTGIDCWHPDENRVLNIRLSDMGLKGQFPRGLENCSGLTGLDLSSNKLFGNIPQDISTILNFVTTLDLSSNSFSGEIPVSLSNCSYMNSLKLDHNRLSGQIPTELGRLGRLKTFSVANNLLVGPVPRFSNSSIGADSYASNPGLCGTPFDACQTAARRAHTAVIVGAAVGGVTLSAIAVGIFMMFFLRRVVVWKKEEDPEGNKWAKSLKGVKGIKFLHGLNLLVK